jgi:hypothetical protein
VSDLIGDTSWWKFEVVPEDRDFGRRVVVPLGRAMRVSEALQQGRDHRAANAELRAMLERVRGVRVNIEGDTKLSERARALLAKHNHAEEDRDV